MLILASLALTVFSPDGHVSLSSGFGRSIADLMSSSSSKYVTCFNGRDSDEQE